MFEDLFVDTHEGLVELSVIPMGGNGHSHDQISEMLDIFESSRLFYDYSRNRASIEGQWADVSPLIYACYERIHERFHHSYLTVSIR
jgi:uncharacterized protein YqgV (UPF0045/DUF77 family)